jgi:protein-L-isoaspartate(D-aspartate) O-methyltransferase
MGRNEQLKQKVAFLNLLKKLKVKQKIIDVFNEVDQSLFFDIMFQDKFYGDEPIRIGNGERSDTFLLLAHMLNHLDPHPNDRILEIGTGSGYATALLSLLCREVLTFDINEKLAAAAKERLYSSGFENIRFFVGDVTKEEYSFETIDRIFISIACKKRPLSLLPVLKENGYMVFPMGPAHMQQIILLQNKPNSATDEHFITSFHEQGKFSLMQGPYGYERIISPEIGDYVDFDEIKRTIEKANQEDEDREKKIRDNNI